MTQVEIALKTKFLSSPLPLLLVPNDQLYPVAIAYLIAMLVAKVVGFAGFGMQYVCQIIEHKPLLN